MTPDMILLYIVRQWMQIPDDRIWFRNQNVTAPTDNNLFVTIGMGQAQIIGTSRDWDGDAQTEKISIAMQTPLDVELCSRSREALERKHEVNMAITSIYAQQMAEAENVQIRRGGDIMDLSPIEGASSLHRFRIPVIIKHVETKENAVEDYFDQFPKSEVVR